MSNKNLIIISNEKIFREGSNFYCDNLDLKILPEGLNEYHEVQYIVRSSNKKGGQKINLENIKVASNIFYVRPKDVRYITENKDHFLSTLKQALQELVDSKEILLKESSTSTIPEKPSFAV